MGFFGGVEELQREDREPVDDEAGSFGVEGSRDVLRACESEEVRVDSLDEVVALLVEAVDRVLDLGDAPVRGGRASRVVFLVPEIEVRAMLCVNDGEELTVGKRQG